MKSIKYRTEQRLTYKDTDDNYNALTHWSGVWQAGTYTKNEQVYDNGWLMIANKTTTERAAPQTSGDPIWASEITGIAPPTLVQETSAEAVWVTGQRYQFGVPVDVMGYRFYVPDVTGTYTYEVWAAASAGDVQQLVAPTTPQVAGWQSVPASTLLPAGVVLDLMVAARTVAQPSTVTATWAVKNENGNPSSTEANFQNNATQIRINTTPKSGDATGLNTVQPGALMTMAGQSWTVTDVDDRGGHVRFDLTPNQGRPSEDDRTITFSWGATAPIPYMRDVDHFAPVVWPEGTLIKGFEDSVYSYGDETLNDNAYGIDLLG